MSKKAVTFTAEQPQVFEYEQTELPPEEKKVTEQSQERKEWFMDMMAISMGIRTPVQRLDEVSFEGVAKYIAEGKCQNIITMAGAGISTSAGIPDYRSPGTGLMDQVKSKYPNVKDVTDLFNIQFFLRDPKPFFERSRRFFEVSLKPTPCHYFVRLLHEKGLLLRHYTQNIDTLERLAGLPADKVVEAHGSYFLSHCMLCDAEYSFSWMEDRVLKDDIPTCEQDGCTGVIKPDIVMYGESLPDGFGELAEEDTLKCDLLIVMGTALAVLPFSALTSKVKTSTPRLYINMDRGKTAKKHPMTDIMFGGSFDFDCEDNFRDVFKQGKCDEACFAMADRVGWGEELRSLVSSEHERIEREDRAKGKQPAPPLSDVTAADTTPDLDLDPAHATSTPAKKPTVETIKTKTEAKLPTAAKEASPKPRQKPADAARAGETKGTAGNRGYASTQSSSRKPGGTKSGASGDHRPRQQTSSSTSSSFGGATTTTTTTARRATGAKNSHVTAADKGKQPVDVSKKTKPIAGK